MPDQVGALIAEIVDHGDDVADHKREIEGRISSQRPDAATVEDETCIRRR
jgi:hypothetical protein